MRIKCIVSYDGTNFCGYQRQKDKRTVQEVIEKVLLTITHKKTNIHAASRTDAKVHAKGQVFHFDTDLDIHPNNWKRGLNSLLPKDIYIRDVMIVDDSFHARYSVNSKEYHYFINMNEYDPILANYMAFYNNLDVSLIEDAVKYFVGTHDFKGFSTDYKFSNTKRTILEANVTNNNNILDIKFVGTGFLRYMVRRMVGTLIEIGLKKKDMEIIKKVFNHEYELAGKTAVPEGLYLEKVNY